MTKSPDRKQTIPQGHIRRFQFNVRTEATEGKVVDHTYQRIGTQINYARPGDVFLQEDQTVRGKQLNYVDRGGKLIPLSEATDEERSHFYKAFPNLKPLE